MLHCIKNLYTIIFCTVLFGAIKSSSAGVPHKREKKFFTFSDDHLAFAPVYRQSKAYEKDEERSFFDAFEAHKKQEAATAAYDAWRNTMLADGPLGTLFSRQQRRNKDLEWEPFLKEKLKNPAWAAYLKFPMPSKAPAPVSAAAAEVD